MCSDQSDWALTQPGFPIRTSSGQSLLDSSPRLFAACHVLLQLLAPRHPPPTLCSLDCIEYFDFSCSLCSSQGAMRSTKHASGLAGARRAPSRLNSVPGVHLCIDAVLIEISLPAREASHESGIEASMRRRVTSISTRCFGTGLSVVPAAP